MALPYDFVASDMDGTMLHSDNTLKPFTLETLRILMRYKKVILVFASGRSFADIRGINDMLQRYISLPEPEVNNKSCQTNDAHKADPATSDHDRQTYMITSNGAVVHDGSTHKMLFSCCIDPAIVKTLYKLIPQAEEGINTHAYQYDDWFCRRDTPDILRYHKISGLRYEVIDDPSTLAPPATTEAKAKHAMSPPSGKQCSFREGCYEGVIKLFYHIYDGTTVDEMKARILAAVPAGSVTVTSSSLHFCEVLAPHVSKGSALRSLLGTLRGEENVDAALKRTIAFGDELNDVEMLNVAGQSCLMANCNPKAKEACSRAEDVGSCNEDGVARKLCEVFNLDTKCVEERAKATMPKMA